MNEIQKTIIKNDTITINQKQWIKISKEDRFYCLLAMNGDTVVPKEDFYFSDALEITDINEDKYEDLRVHYPTNGGSTAYTYFYSVENQSFRKINSSFDFIFEKTPNSPFFYNYCGVGCADEHWISELLKIDKDSAIVIGNIEGNGCSMRENYIKINKVQQDSELVFINLNYQKYIKKNDDKFDFIKNYWVKNWKYFAISSK